MGISPSVLRKIVGDAVNTHMRTISANDYEKLDIDLGIARTDEVGLAKETTLSSLLSAMVKFRWGEDIEPDWIVGAEATAPAAGTNLVSKTVGTGVTGRIFGIHISANEANEFKLIWTSGGVARSLRFSLASAGVIYIASQTPMNKDLLADEGTTISIQNVGAGSAGIVYQASLLYAEK